MIPGDVILAIDGHPVTSVPEMLSGLDDKRVGDAARLRIWRAGKTTGITVELQAADEAATL